MKDFQGEIGTYVCGLVAIATGVFLLQFGWHTQNYILAIIGKLIIVIGIGLWVSPSIIQLIGDHRYNRIRKKKKSLIHNSDFKLYDSIIEKCGDVIREQNLRLVVVDEENVFMIKSSQRLVAFSIQHAKLTTSVLHKNAKTQKWYETFLFWLVEPSKRLDNEIDVNFDALTPEIVKQGLLLEIDISIDDIRKNVELLFNSEKTDICLCNNYSTQLSHAESKKVESMVCNYLASAPPSQN